MIRHVPQHAKTITQRRPTTAPRDKRAILGVEKVIPIIQRALSNSPLTRLPTAIGSKPTLILHGKAKYKMLDGFFQTMKNLGIEIERQGEEKGTGTFFTQALHRLTEESCIPRPDQRKDMRDYPLPPLAMP